MPTRFCMRCWREQPLLATTCAACGAPLYGPESNGVPYTEKLLRALDNLDNLDNRENLGNSDGDSNDAIHARAIQALGYLGDAHDQRVARALMRALSGESHTGMRPSNSAQVAAIYALIELDICQVSDALAELAGSALTRSAVGVCAAEGLGSLARNGCAQAAWQLEQLAREAALSAVRSAATIELARLYEPN